MEAVLGSENRGIPTDFYRISGGGAAGFLVLIGYIWSFGRLVKRCARVVGTMSDAVPRLDKTTFKVLYFFAWHGIPCNFERLDITGTLVNTDGYQ